MAAIVRARAELAPNVTQLLIEAPEVAAAHRPGQFVIVRLREGSERIPLSVADADPVEGTLLLAIQAVGKSTGELVALQPGEVILDLAGPLGRPTELIERGRAVCVGGGVGAAAIHPIAKALAAAGVEVVSVLGGRSREWVLFEPQLRKLGELIVCTDDGSYGREGLVTGPLAELVAAGDVDRVYAVGPVPMMRACAETTRERGVPTVVSLNSIMVDGTGMCGGCRVSVHGQTRYACVDGPEFDGHGVDFALLADRLGTYREFERRALERWQRGHRCAIGLDRPSGSRPEQRPLPDELPPDQPAGREPGPAEPRISAKARMAIPRQQMPARPAAERGRVFDEVNLGFDERLARLEAQRCLQCKKPTCVQGCPVGVDIPGFLDLVERGDLAGAAQSLLRDNALPCITGRVCPQESQCEGACLRSRPVRGRPGEPVAIGHLERFVADWAAAHGVEPDEPPAPPSGRRVAVVGSGPAGLTAADVLSRRGHQVTVFEGFHTAGGVLSYGIPEFRLPKRIVAEEIDRLVRRGVRIEPNAVIGPSSGLHELRARFDAVFVAVGAGLPIFLDIPGENLKGVYSANEYLTRVNLMGAYRPDADTPVLTGRRVAVIGGGNVAMDAARTALRLGATAAAAGDGSGDGSAGGGGDGPPAEVTIVYRRSRAELPARLEEVGHAEEEGVRLEFLAAPLRIHGDEQGWVNGLTCIRMELGEPDRSGRRRPVPVPGSEFELACDQVVVALGTRASPLLTKASPELGLTAAGYIQADEDGRASMDGVFAGGDIIRGSATVILAMGDGKRAAAAIDAYLRDQPPGR